ncbi:MAG: CPBP family intramembrane metalloprotease [Armatimonadetes bacterium]|nr:CPBP family intramembrane metalloprotease [Armatimonadota bacterium]
MLARLRSLYDAEIRPALAGTTPPAALAALLGTALLINKRYLGDPLFGGAAAHRWSAAGAWLLASVLLLAALRWVQPRVAGGWVGGLLGALALALTLRFDSLGSNGSPRLDSAVFLMLIFGWIVAAPAAAGIAPDERANLRRAVLWACLGILLTLAVLTGRGPALSLLHDARFEKINWCLLTFLWLLVVPSCWSAGLYGEGLRDVGGGLGRWRFWLPFAASFLVVMVVLVVAFAGRQPDFVRYYPMYKNEWPNYDPRVDGWRFFAVYEAAYGLYFLAWEFFFRGWLLFRLERDFGANAIWMQTVPFVLMHVGKPGLELHSSLVAGVVLGWLAWRGRSFWPCFLVHWAVAATMDTAAMWHGLPAGR